MSMSSTTDQKNKKFKIVISIGDESGVGPEVILKAIGSSEYPKDFHTQIIGSKENLVKTYNKFKNQKFENGNGLEIYSVSLDKKYSSWLKAMTDDKLFWKYHVSDLKGWQSDGAAIYGVRSIPQTFIIDGNGVIVAKNLKGGDLNNFLNSKKLN